MFKSTKKILIITILAAFLLPFLSLAAGLQLETIYPASPSAQQVITGRAKLPDIIRYVISWTIIIAALVTAFSLIYAGVQYLTSVGRPNAVAAAKKRIGQCLLGLLIIASSYLVLQTINPQLTIMTIKKQQVGSGIVMFTQAGLYGSDKDASDVAATNWCYTPTVTVDSCTAGAKTACYNPNMVNGFNTPDSDTLENLMKAGEARFLGYDIPNTTAEFGNMAHETIITDDIVNFTKFPLYAIGFWGDEKTQGGALVVNAKIFAYPNTQYNIAAGAPSAVEYRMDGKAGKDGTVSAAVVNNVSNGGRASCKADTPGSGANELGMKLITIHNDFFKSEVPCYDKQTLYSFDPNNITDQPIRKKIQHPPLSIKMQGKGAGVILYSQTSGGSHAFAASAEDFNLSNVKFDNLADEIEVRNIEPKKGRIHDYLVILHSSYYFAGDLRAFFEKRGAGIENDPQIRLPNIYNNDSFWKNKGGLLENIVKVDLTDLEKKPQYFGNGQVGNTDVGKYCGVDGHDCSSWNGGLGEPDTETYDKLFFFYPTDTLLGVGNQPNPNQATLAYDKVAVNVVDQFGRLKTSDRASSLELFELERKQGSYWFVSAGGGYESTASKQQSIVCREVKLCTGKGLLNDCLTFVPNTPDYIQGKYKDYNSFVLPMPLYAPINIPNEVEGWMKTYDDTGATVIAKKKVEFSDKIKSISIDGDCVVVLFENGIKDMQKCFDCTACNVPPNITAVCKKTCGECWDGGGPGSNSEVFTESVSDLTTHAISKCGGRERFGFGDRKNCASAIAIFPIKKATED